MPLVLSPRQRAAAFAKERMQESDANLRYQIISSANATVLIPMRGTFDQWAAARSAGS